MKHSQARNIDEFIAEFQQDLRHSKTIVASSVVSEKQAETDNYPQSLFPPVMQLFGSLGITRPYASDAGN